MGIGQPRGFRRNRRIAEQGNIRREPERVAVDRGDNRLLDIEQVLDHPPAIGHHDPAPATALALGGLVATGEVATHGKCFARPCQQDRIDVAILRQVQPDLLELVVQGGVHWKTTHEQALQIFADLLWQTILRKHLKTALSARAA